MLRLATLAGVGDTYSRIRLDLVVNLLVVRARLIGELEVFGGDQYRPLLHVRDVATAIVPHVASDACGIYNLGNENVTILELAQRVVQSVGKADIRVVDVPFQDTRNYRVSFERARRELQFVSQHSIGEAIDDIAELIDNGRVKDLSMAQFSNLEALRPYLRPEAIPLGREVRNAHRLARHLSPTGVTVSL
jgi:nucleoside-diphosphate-sugar epimerase